MFERTEKTDICIRVTQDSIGRRIRQYNDYLVRALQLIMATETRVIIVFSR